MLRDVYVIAIIAADYLMLPRHAAFRRASATPIFRAARCCLLRYAITPS